MGAAAKFEHVTSVVILVNVAVVVGGLMIDGYEQLFQRIETAIVLFFVAETLVRLRAGGWRFFRRPLNVLDVLCVLLAVLPVLPVPATVLRVVRLGRAARMVHLLRHASVLLLHRLLPVSGPMNRFFTNTKWSES
jgi:hypothetical protein